MPTFQYFTQTVVLGSLKQLMADRNAARGRMVATGRRMVQVAGSSPVVVLSFHVP